MLCLVPQAALLGVVLVYSATYVLSSNFSVKFPVGAQLISVGGSNFNGYTDDVDIISLSTNTHKRAAMLPTKAGGFGSTLVKNTVYVVGGASFDDEYSSRFLAYDVTANTWTNLRDFPYKIAGNAVVAVNGSIFSFGGSISDDEYMNYTFKYDVSTRIWWRIATLLPTMQPYPCVVAHQSSIYLIAYTGDLYRSDDGAHTWKKISSMLQKRFIPSCAMLPNGLIMVAGGIHSAGSQNSVDSVDLYNIAEDSWASMAPMTRARVEASAVVIPESDSVVVCGGAYVQNGTATSVYDDCELFSMAENQWGFTDFKLDMPRVAFGLFYHQTRL